MIGLVNAAGAFQTPRVQTSEGPISNSGEFGTPPMWVVPHEVVREERETTAAIEPIEFEQPQPESNVASPQEQNAAPAATQPVTPESTENQTVDELGTVLDMTA